jgi:5'-deoxynucleotidase YfbR-like HD superfamily hydrolase
MSKISDQLTATQSLISSLSAIERAHYHAGSPRHENVAEHSLSLATLVLFLHRQVNSKTNLELALKYAIVHDFVEIHAGDTNTFASPSDRNQKEIRERKALKRFENDFQFFPDLVQLTSSYQESDPEAQFVWTVDKIQQLILGQMDDWRPYRELGITKAAFNAKHLDLQAKASPELAQLYLDIIAWCNETY